MSFYPADQGLIIQHSLYDVPEERSSIFARLSGSTSQALDAASSVALLALWAGGLYCVLKGLYLFASWSSRHIRRAIKKQQDNYDNSLLLDRRLCGPLSSLIRTRDAKCKDDDDLENQLSPAVSSTSSSSSTPSLPHTPDLASPALSYSTLSSPASSVNSLASQFLPSPHTSESFQRIKSPPAPGPKPAAYPPPRSLDYNLDFSSVRILDPYDCQLASVAEHPMVKIH